jgi:peptide deformylase
MLSIITIGEPLLAKTSALVPDIDADVRRLVEQMFETMGTRGVGLAAVQVGAPVRLFVTRAPHDKPRVFINPDILETSMEEETLEEGCLSVPGLYTDIVRPASVRVQAWNEKGRPFTLSAGGILARVIQHELDHLNGILFVDRIDAKRRKRLLASYDEKLRF